jgi:hypothetical protein
MAMFQMWQGVDTLHTGQAATKPGVETTPRRIVGQSAREGLSSGVAFLRPSSPGDFGVVAGDCLKSVTGESTDLWSRREVCGETNRFSKSGSRQGDTQTRSSRLAAFD